MKQCLAAVVLSLVLPSVTLAQNPTTQTLSKLPTDVAGSLYGFALRQADGGATPSSNSSQQKTRAGIGAGIGATIGALLSR